MATSQVETVSTGADKAKLAVAVGLVIAAIAGFYALSKQGALVQWGVLLLGIAAAVVVFLVSESGRQLVGFSKDSVKEVKKSCLAHTQRKRANDSVRFCVCGRHGFVFVADGSNAGMGPIRPGSGLEGLMTDAMQVAGLVGTPETLAPTTNPDLRWYIVHAYSGMEKAVERNITERINRAGMQNKFGRILVPTEEVVEMRNGKRKTTERRLFPGYVFVEMVMEDDTWHLVKHTSKVTGFVGGAKNRPAPISEAEIQKIVDQVQEGNDKPRHKIEFMVGELVRVKEGPFTDFNGSVEEVNYEKSRLRVSVAIFGRSTPVELEFSQVEKT